jgi:hypothetical protein
MTVLAAMAIYTAIYRRPARSLSPSFAGATPLAVHFATYGFPPASWFAMRGYADLVADRTLRPFPGSGDDLLVRTGDGTLDPPCPRLTIENGATLHALLVSPVGGYARTSALLFVDVMRPTPFPGFPELHVSPATAVTLDASAALGSGLQVVLPVTWTMLSSSLVVQGAALAPSRTTGNPLFTTSDAHEVVIR